MPLRNLKIDADGHVKPMGRLSSDEEEFRKQILNELQAVAEDLTKTKTLSDSSYFRIESALTELIAYRGLSEGLRKKADHLLKLTKLARTAQKLPVNVIKKAPRHE
jgi:hypothetical protein